MSIKAIRKALDDAIESVSGNLHLVRGVTDNHATKIDVDIAKRRKTDVEAGRIVLNVTFKPFKKNKKHNTEAFEFQRDEQLDALENISLEQWIKNREAYADGRPLESLKAQAAMRQSEAADMRSDLVDALGREPTAADLAKIDTDVSNWMKTQAATHRLDGIAGGDVTDISGVGDARVNSSLGAQWSPRLEQIDVQVIEFIKANPDVDLSTVFFGVAGR